MASVFISYKHYDARAVNELLPLLQAGGHRVWFDERIGGGEDWWNVILSQIDECDVFVFLISQDSLQSAVCTAEYEEAYRLRKQIFPIVVRGGTTVPEYLRKIQHEDISNGITPLISVRISTQVNILASKKETEQKPRNSKPVSLPPDETPIKDIEIFPRSLVNFPEAFLPLTIIVGDRRENTPKSPGDLLAWSASASDLRWVLCLSLPKDTEIISDKVFLNASEDYIREKFGQRNLLVIGSPAANHVARVVNETALFNFKIDLAIREEIKQRTAESRKARNNMAALREFIERLKRDSRTGFILNQLRVGGFIDPTYKFKMRGNLINPDNDYGVISLCRNPYADSTEFLAILAAGVHLPGTIHSLLILSEAKDSFRQRSFGGIFRVDINIGTSWERRMEDAIYEWSTEPYSSANLREGLQEIRDDLSTSSMTDEDLDNRLSLLSELTKD